jgi:hypothetical protein
MEIFPDLRGLDEGLDPVLPVAGPELGLPFTEWMKAVSWLYEDHHQYGR